MQQVTFKFANGEQVRDIITGYTGTVNCLAVWINGCKRCSVQPLMKEGESTLPDSVWIDEESLEKISDGIKGRITPSETGGPSHVNKEANQRSTR
jgi:hypothetical protein